MNIRVLTALLFCGALASHGAEPKRLTLQDAVQLALRQNRSLKIAKFKIAEHEQKKAEAKANYFPEIKNQSNLLHTTSEQNIEIPTGAFGVIPNVGPVPTHDVLINQGGRTLFATGSTVLQPLTQLIRIRQANRIAASEVAVSRVELARAENDVALQVHSLYYGILITGLQKQAAEAQSESAAVRLREAQEDIRNGAALKNAELEGRAGLLESKQAVLTASLHLADLTTDLNELLGLPLDTPLELTPVEPAAIEEPAREDYLQTALAKSPHILAAEEALRQSEAGVAAAKSAYIPDVTAFARHSYQNGVPFLIHNFGTFGFTLSYDVFEFGKRRAVLREREARRNQARENLERLKESVRVEIERGYHKAERTRQMLQVAAEVVKLRQENERIASNQIAQGAALASAGRQASAASLKALADLLQAQLAYLLAKAELERTAGLAPGA